MVKLPLAINLALPSFDLNRSAITAAVARRLSRHYIGIERHPAYVEAVGRARPEDTVLTRGFSGRLGRSVRNQVTDAFEGAVKPAPYPIQRALMASVASSRVTYKDTAGQSRPSCSV